MDKKDDKVKAWMAVSKKDHKDWTTKTAKKDASDLD